ncbi:MAG: hypothetical protein K2L22_08225 [Muribaculaceae bacterium]|nr:hypothetical protein [Muribaculaceae bacterium]
MKVIRILILSLLTTAINSCSTEEDMPSPVEPSVDNPTNNVYFEQNKWIYAQMNQHYLWREDLPDSTSCNYDQTPKEFFSELLSEKDRFSYMLTNSSYTPTSERANPILYQTYKDCHNNTASLVLYVDNSIVTKTSLKRGDWIDIIFQDNTTIQYTKVIVKDERFSYDKNTITLSISNTSKQSTVLLDSIYSNGTGYLCYKEFDSIEDLIPSLKKFQEKGIDNLVLDLRYNPGGYVKTCKYLTNCIAPELAYGDIFQITKYNDRISKENIIATGYAELFDNFGFPSIDDDHSKGGYPIIPLNLSRLYVLTSNHTASASEATILCLKPYMEVIQIGEATVGKGVGSYTISDHRFKYAIQPITMQYYNKGGETVSDSGLFPDFYIAEGYNVAKKDLGDLDEPLLNIAFSIINSNPFNTNIQHINLRSNFENSLTPIGDPSYVTEYKNKHYNESN